MQSRFWRPSRQQFRKNSKVSDTVLLRGFGQGWPNIDWWCTPVAAPSNFKPPPATKGTRPGFRENIHADVLCGSTSLAPAAGRPPVAGSVPGGNRVWQIGTSPNGTRGLSIFPTPPNIGKHQNKSERAWLHDGGGGIAVPQA